MAKLLVVVVVRLNFEFEYSASNVDGHPKWAKLRALEIVGRDFFSSKTKREKKKLTIATMVRSSTN